MKRIERKLEADINVVQAGFRQGSGTRDHIFNLRMIIQKCREFTNHLSHALSNLIAVIFIKIIECSDNYIRRNLHNGIIYSSSLCMPITRMQYLYNLPCGLYKRF